MASALTGPLPGREAELSLESNRDLLFASLTRRPTPFPKELGPRRHGGLSRFLFTRSPLPAPHLLSPTSQPASEAGFSHRESGSGRHFAAFLPLRATLLLAGPG